MHFRPFSALFALGLGSLLIACSSDTNRGAGPDGGSLDAGTGGGHASGGATSSSGGSGTGATSSSGNSSGGSGASAGGQSSGGASSGGASSGASSGGASSGGSGNAGAQSDSGVDGSAGSSGTGGTAGDAGDAGGATGPIEHVFLIAMENHDFSEVIGDEADAPYVNDTLVKGYASTSNFNDVLDLAIPSEPHYVLVEAGTNAFSDVTFTTDSVPGPGNVTASTDHLATQMKTASVSWMAYEQGIDATSGNCPINASGYYMPKHDPFIFFSDVSGSPPSATNAYCVAHHKEIGALDDDLKNDQVASYNFITPDQCHDMHGQMGCPDSNTVRAGDDWLKSQLATLIPYVNTHHGVILVFWDEGDATLKVPFLAIGPTVKKNYVSSVSFTHRSITRTIERIFGLPYLDTVKNDTDLADLFESGTLP